MNTFSVNSMALFLGYLVGGMALLALFVKIYTRVTPYCDFTHIRAGHTAPAIALGGAMMGFTLPLLAMSYVSIHFADFMLWSLISATTQLIIYKVVAQFLPMQVDDDNNAVAITYAFVSVCTGLINAFSLIPRA